jgi:peptide-methionine (S)-S-oxide reductase
MRETACALHVELETEVSIMRKRSAHGFLWSLALLPVPVLSAAGFPAPLQDIPAPANHQAQTAVLAGGCFWGVEEVFEHVKGVLGAVSGYAGGSKSTAVYEVVSTGRTGHAESVRVTYDPSQISYGQLLQVFFSVTHDPTQVDGQGPDRGTQYRSAIFYATAEQKQVSEAYIRQLNDARIFPRPIATQLTLLAAFYVAEDYHQHFAARNPNYAYVVAYDLPKVQRLQQQFPRLWKEK